MMDKTFLLQLGLSFVVGSFWISLTTYVADRFGSKTGGFIGGLPSTAAVSLFFIGMTQSPQVASQATTVFPLSYAFTGLFLVLFAVFWRRGFFVSLTSALGIWFLLSACVILFKLENFLVSVIVYIFFFVFALYFLEFRLQLISSGREKMKHTAQQLLGRAGFGGLVVAFTVFMSRVGGPVFGGIFSAFPAVFISVLIISYRSRGMEFSRSLTKPLLVTGMISIFLYGVSVRYLYPPLGLAWGTLGSFFISMFGALFSLFLIQKKLS